MSKKCNIIGSNEKNIPYVCIVVLNIDDDVIQERIVE